MAEVFRTSFPVRFAHCDAAGMIFYPRALELVNAVVEDWFATGLGKSFNALHLEDGLGIPLVKLEATFHAPSLLGEVLDFELKVTAMGGSSMDLEVTAAANASPRFTIRSRAVFARLDTRKSIEIPAALRTAIEPYLQ
jgi:4-hydroxybenzoyl-CoA thioesterase